MSRVLRVGGMVPLTTLDYPGQLACVLFCQGLCLALSLLP